MSERARRQLADKPVRVRRRCTCHVAATFLKFPIKIFLRFVILVLDEREKEIFCQILRRNFIRLLDTRNE